MREALRYLDDPIALERNPLAGTALVVSLCQAEFERRTCARGLALAAVLRNALGEISHDLPATPVGVLASLIREGRTQADAARIIGRSAEHVCRRWKPVLVRLVLDRMEQARVPQHAV